VTGSDSTIPPNSIGTLPKPDQVRVLDVKEVSVEIDGGRRLLDNVSFWVPKGEFVCLCGPNGAGKSTLLKTILGLMRPTSGTISILGKPPGKAGSKVGYVPSGRRAICASRPARWISSWRTCAVRGPRA
jgi:ABC-type Mn2+/Zn2+ transport system ATPase subunit